MKPKYLYGYGRLEWLEPEDYFSQEDWTYEGEDEDFEYSIVFSYTRQEYRYTII